MRSNVITQVASFNNAFDIAIEKAGTADKEIRYDVASLDVNTRTFTSAKNGARFKLVQGPDAAQVARQVDSITLAKFALGQPVQLFGRTYASVQDYVGGAQGDLAVTRVSPRLAAALGFTPTAAVRV
jgi:hypothetical protein